MRHEIKLARGVTFECKIDSFRLLPLVDNDETTKPMSDGFKLLNPCNVLKQNIKSSKSLRSSRDRNLSSLNLSEYDRCFKFGNRLVKFRCTDSSNSMSEIFTGDQICEQYSIIGRT